jgi:chorismate mutase-like protein
MDIEFWREKIDAIDERLVELLNERCRCALEIGHLKRIQKMVLYQPGREKQVILHVLRENQGPLKDDAVQRLFERIIDESRMAERIAMEEEKGSGDAEEK